MHRPSAFVLLGLGVFLGVGGAVHAEPGAPSAPAKQKPIDFSREIRPLLAENCFACHGPDEKTRKGKLRLDLREEALKPGRSGDPALVPGKSVQSAVIKRIFTSDDTEVMPPHKSNKTLKPHEKELLKRWVDEGAEYRIHWAFVPPVKVAPPKVQTQGWARNEIDAFILARLEKAGLKPSPEAERATLIRRLSFDLRGLPPTLQEVQTFLNDQSPDAYEKLVDRMLASPHYGEKMATLWLDLARFGDTSGYHFDSTRQMWLWRDYVIQAYNKNKPFDQFTIEQLAGDLLPGATTEQKVASGFNRNTRFNEEGGADPEEFVIRYNVDRTNTLGQVWLGMTLQCAECHSHKYDPISQKEYYQLYAYFTGIREPMVSMNHNQPLPPLLRVATPAQEKALAEAKADIQALEKRIQTELAKIQYQEPPAAPTPMIKPPEDIVWIDDDTPAGAQLQGDGAGWQWGQAPQQPVQSGKRSMKRTGPGLHQHYFTGAQKPLLIRSAADRLFAYVYLDPKNPPKAVMLQFNDGNWEHRAYWGEDVCFLAGSADAANHRKMGPLPRTGEWVRLEVSPEKVGLKPGTPLNGWAFTQHGGTVYYDRAGIRSVPPDDRYLHSQRAWEERDRGNPTLPGEVRAALNVAAPKRTEAQKTLLRNHYLRHVHAGSRGIFEPLEKQIAENTRKIKDLDAAMPTVMVSEEMPQRRPAFVLHRGDFQQRGEKVEPGTPGIFPPLPKDAPANRLSLARWLVSPDHPLTARVTVNRLWAQMLGTGIVKTVGDFGTQGDMPSHPELLDFLATEFIARKWDVKAMLRLIALSATYRQSSGFGEKIPEIDPDNRLLWRAPRFRLTAEEVRDNALAVSGLLTRKVGGPSVMPYQPPTFYQGKNESWKWEQSKGEDLYRRGLYTFWRRTSLHPMFAVFDAPSREECTAARPRTNTPLQALVTLNDPTFVEASRVFAQKILQQGPSDLEGRLVFAFQTTVARKPSALEVQVLRKHYQTLRERYQKDPKGATAVVRVGQYVAAPELNPAEHAAWMGIANVLLNLDETIMRE